MKESKEDIFFHWIKVYLVDNAIMYSNNFHWIVICPMDRIYKLSNNVDLVKYIVRTYNMIAGKDYQSFEHVILVAGLVEGQFLSYYFPGQALLDERVPHQLKDLNPTAGLLNYLE